MIIEVNESFYLEYLESREDYLSRVKTKLDTLETKPYNTDMLSYAKSFCSSHNELVSKACTLAGVLFYQDNTNTQFNEFLNPIVPQPEAEETAKSVILNLIDKYTALIIEFKRVDYRFNYILFKAKLRGREKSITEEMVKEAEALYHKFNDLPAPTEKLSEIYLAKHH